MRFNSQSLNQAGDSGENAREGRCCTRCVVIGADMPRQARLDVPGAMHHIMVRGINKSTIFEDDQDREKSLKRQGDIITEAKNWKIGTHPISRPEEL